MNSGIIVEYIDKQKIICAVVLMIKKQRLKLLTENNREINLSSSRLLHISKESLDISATRDSLVKALKKKSKIRNELLLKINIKELWELLYEEQEEIDLSSMTLFCFDPPLTCNYESAVLRAFFKDKLYFKFNKDKFIPYSKKQFENRLQQKRKAQEDENLINKAMIWLKNVMDKKINLKEKPDSKIVNILKNYYLFENESTTASIAKKILSKAGINSLNQIFKIFVNLGIWDKDENIDLIKFDIPINFSSKVLKKADETISCCDDFMNDPKRIDLTHLDLITIDSSSTMDYDDAISLEKNEHGYTIGIHIIDVACFVKDNDIIDREAKMRGSSIYMPDDKISMLPLKLSENFCSLIKGEIRPGISTIVKLNHFFEIIDYKVMTSIIKVNQQITYKEANMLNGKDDLIPTFYKVAVGLREKRLESGAIHITLPEITVWLEENKKIRIFKTNIENPSRIIVSEMMILANFLMAQFIANHNVPAMFRTQSSPKLKFFNGIEPSLLLNWMQRRQLSRMVVDPEPSKHAGLGLEVYLTATSPIRRYYDLVSQRQIRSILGYEQGYLIKDIEMMIQLLNITIKNINITQFQRRRYWIFKYLETIRGTKLQAVVLDSFKEFYIIMIEEYMVECKMPSTGLSLKPGDHIEVTLQHIDARRDQLSVFA
ncbi:MAG: ribonuclease II [Desulfobacteraceae bacterium 4572_130]|nr:MAG: ribonuclease II [Desulfobacteraceae bacterium 4572_130]